MILNKQINYLISQKFLPTQILTFEPETPTGHPKYQDSACSLVSNKNFRKMLSSNSWCPGPGKVGQEVLHLLRH